MSRSSSPFTLGHFEKWAKGLILDSGGGVRLEPFQVAFLEDVFAGAPVCWLILPEGNGKTTLLASLGLYGLRFADEASIPIAASSRDQARIMYRQMKGFVVRAGLHGRDAARDGVWFECFDGYRQIQLRKEGLTRRGEAVGVIEIHAADAGTADGVIPFPFAFLDELHRHKDLALHRTWVGKLKKRGAQEIGISTAGEPGHEFEIARERIALESTETVRDGAFRRYVSGKVVMHEYAVRDSKLILDASAVKEANPLGSITVQTLEDKLKDPTMTEAHWRRFTCNIATLDEGKEPFVDATDWDDLVDPDAVIDDGASICLGADGSRTWDTTVVARACLEADGSVLVDATVFSVRADIPCHVLHAGGKIDFDDIEAFVVDQFDRFHIDEASYDPRYLERSMELVARRLPEARVHAVEPSSKNMRDALQCLFNVVSEKRLRHAGDPVVRAHMLNAGADRGQGSELRRVRKIDARFPIDAVPAIALAVWRAVNVQESVYDSRGMVMV